MSDVRLLGGEMEFWSDRPADDPPVAGGAVLAALVRQVLPRSGHVVVLGPHPAAVLDLLEDAGLTVTVLLRSVPDAERLTAERPTFAVAAGDLARADAADLDGSADFLLAAGGLEPCSSADASWRGWAELGAAAAELLAADGIALVGLERTLGTGTLAAPHRREADRSRRAWFPTFGHDASRPLDAAATADALGRSSAPAGTWLLAPTLDDPRLALPASLAPGSTGTVAGALLERASSTVAAPDVDPRVVVRDAVGQGLAAALAPAAVHLVGAEPEPRAVVLQDDATTTVGSEVLAAPGELLESRLLERVVRQDVPAVRRDLEALARYVETAPVGLSAEPTDVLVDDAGCRPVPGASTRAWATGGQAFAGAVLAVAERLEALGWRRPWPDDLDAEGLATVMAGLVGLDLGPANWAEARAARRRGKHGAGDDAAEAGPDDRPDAVRRLRVENEALRGRVRALEGALRSRDRQLWADRAAVTASTREERQGLRAEADERRRAT